MVKGAYYHHGLQPSTVSADKNLLPTFLIEQVSRWKVKSRLKR